MALIARRTGREGMAPDYTSAADAREYITVRQYNIIDRYKGGDTIIGTAWGINARDALKTYRMERQGKTDF